MKIKELIQFIEKNFPLTYQESYDNSGFLIGDSNQEIKKVLLTLDIDFEVIEKAKEIGANLIVAHHPIIFKPIKNILTDTFEGKIITEAIKNDISIYASHTSLDASYEGINYYLAQKLGLKNLKILQPVQGKLKKLVTFVPSEYAEKVREAIFKAGAGVIGNYDSCSYNTEGYGTFKANEGTNPFVGEIGKIHKEPEIRVETIFPEHLTSEIIKALITNHPYEEVAYDIYPLENQYELKGFGIYGETEKEYDEIEFLKKIKEVLNIPCLKHSKLRGKKIKRVGICSGSCGFLLKKAIGKNLDLFISGEFKYHDYLPYSQDILIAEAGHFETEIIFTEVFYELFTKNFTFEVAIFKQKNPVYYL